MTASFLPKPVTGVNGNGMHTNMSIAKGDTNLFWDPKGEEQLSDTAWTFVDRILTSALGSLPDPEPERQRLSTARSTLRGAEPDQGVGDRPRRDGAYPDRQRALGPDRGALDRARCQPVHGALLAAPHRARGAGRSKDNGENGAIGPILPDNIYDAIRLCKGSKFTAELLGAEVHERFAELKRDPGRPLPQAARRPHQAGRDPVPPRGDEPVSVVAILASSE